jgi:hypothetical protein
MSGRERRGEDEWVVNGRDFLVSYQNIGKKKKSIGKPLHGSLRLALDREYVF